MSFFWFWNPKQYGPPGFDLAEGDPHKKRHQEALQSQLAAKEGVLADKMVNRILGENPVDLLELQDEEDLIFLLIQ